MISVDVQINKSARTMQGRLGRSTVKDMAATILRAAHVTASVISEVVLEKFPGGTSQLARSFIANVGFVTHGDDEVSARTYSPLPYARIQDAGGTIKPKSAKNLAIPLSPLAKRKWPRDWDENQLRLVVLRGKSFLVEKLDKGKLVFHYLLKPQVTLTGEKYIAAAQRRAKPLVDQVIRAGLAKLLEDGRRG